MRFAQDSFEGNSISAYAEDGITINEEVFTSSLVVTPDRLINDWLPATFEQLRPEHIARLDQLEPEIIVIGTGNTLHFPSPEFTAGFLAQGVGVEIMDTPAACRTYNILLSEGRHVIAALLIS